VTGPEAVVSVYDHGFLYGDGIYETMRAYKGTVFKSERHIERLGRSAFLLKLKIPDKKYIMHSVYETLEANKLSEAYIRLTISRGKGPVGLDPALCKEISFVVFAQEFRKYPEAYYRDGVRLIIAKTRRNFSGALDPRIKSLNFLNNIIAKMEAKERGAHEAVMLNPQGFLAEGTISNIFFVKEGKLCTPSVETGILDGITREIVIDLAKKDGMKVKEGLFSQEDLFKATEVFFTNTTSEVMPVSMLENRAYCIGKITKRLHRLYKEEVKRYLKDAAGK
jgi:branched-chain amino acid aminotransferase